MTSIPAHGPGSNSGHGHVWERPDGAKVRCGGPGICQTCANDAVMYGFTARPNQPVTAPATTDVADEIGALGQIVAILEQMSPAARQRSLIYLGARYGWPS